MVITNKIYQTTNCSYHFLTVKSLF